LSLVAVVCHEQTDLEPGAAGIEQRGDALARGAFALLVLAPDTVGAAALFETRLQVSILSRERTETR